MRRELLVAGMLVACCSAQAQLHAPDPDWKEAETPPPPALKVDKLVPFDMPSSLLRWGIDPGSVSIGSDGIVRYVVVARSDGGAVNAMYEGIRCNTAEVKVYARSYGGDWSVQRNADWKPLQVNGAQNHSLVIARNAACIGQGPNRSPEHIARDLGRGADTKFRPEIR